MKLKKRNKLILLVSTILIVTGFMISLFSFEKSNGIEVVVYKSPTCGCCRKWISHLNANGFSVKAINTHDVNSIKQQQGVQPKLASCHTAIVEGYTIEGHVPAKDIQRLLKEKPKVKGLTVPGMPIGSPGMEQGEKKDPYAVLTFQENGDTTVYTKYP